MTDRDALLRAILQDPQDDTPRLIFADWLDERGECERAEFVKLAVAMNRKDGFSQEVSNRCRELLIANWTTWDEWLTHLPVAISNLAGPRAEEATMRTGRGIVVAYSRGFIASLACSWSDWLRHERSLYWWSGATDATERDCDSKHDPRLDINDRFDWVPHSGCPRCKGSKKIVSRGPRPFVATAQPLTAVNISDYSGSTVTEEVMEGNRMMLRGSHGEEHWFDRVKCPVCDDVSLRASEMDAPDLVRECPTCRGNPLNEWTCPTWPGLTFAMPTERRPLGFPEFVERYANDVAGMLGMPPEQVRQITEPINHSQTHRYGAHGVT